jgi:hypothetical protein
MTTPGRPILRSQRLRMVNHQGWRSSALAVSSSRRRPLTPRWPSAASSGSRLGDGMTLASSRCTNGLPGTPRKARRSHRDRIGVAAGR